MGIKIEVPADPSALEAYMREVSRYELISREKEIELGRRARQGDTDAIQELCQANLRFVISVAKKYQRRGLPLADLIQAGNVGLVTAAARFDPEYGVKFITYAVYWIRQAIQSALAQYGRPLRLPVNRVAELSRILRARQELASLLDREPSSEEIASRLDTDPATVESLQALEVGEVRLDAPVGEDESSTVGERLRTEERAPPSAEVEQRLVRAEIEEALGGLRERDALVLRLYYGLVGEREHTLQEIGDLLGVSRERVRQLRDRALGELREGAKGDVLASFHD